MAIYRYERNIDEDGQEVNWLFIGRIRSHRGPIVSVLFIEDPSKPPGTSLRLFTVGYDRLVVEYDLPNSTVTGGVRLVATAVVEQTARPVSAIVIPSSFQDDRTRGVAILVMNNEYKIKVINPDKMTGQRTEVARVLDAPPVSIKTILGPTFGSPPSLCGVIPCCAPDHQFMWYTCPEKVSGILCLPITGNPHNTAGVITHPGRIVCATCTPDGRYLATCGGADLSIGLWEMSPQAVEAASVLGGHGPAPFWEQLEGGPDGEVAEDLRDYFVYAQIRRQGEDTREERDVVGWVRPDDVPDLFCALGHFPSKFDIRVLGPWRVVQLTRARN